MSHSDEEVVENLKHWWSRFGTASMLGLAVVLFAFAGWRYWDSSRDEAATAAAKLGQQMVTAQQRLIANPDDKAANTELQRLGRQIIDEYGSTPYAIDASLLLARRAVDQGDLAGAAKQLRATLDMGLEADTEVVVRTRLARVLAAQKQFDAALAELAELESVGLEPLVAEIRGDIALQKGDREAARAAYQAADKALADRDEARPVLDLKLADVGLEPAKRASDQPAEARN